MSKLAVAIGILVCGLCIETHPRTLDDTVSEVPFSFEKGYVIAQAKIRDQIPVEMVLATGAEHSTSNGDFIEKYKLSLGYTYDKCAKYRWL